MHGFGMTDAVMCRRHVHCNQSRAAMIPASHDFLIALAALGERQTPCRRVRCVCTLWTAPSGHSNTACYTAFRV